MVPRVHTHILQNEDKRIVCDPVDGRVFHHRHHRCGIQQGDPKAVKIEESEIHHLLESVYNTHL